MFGDLFIVPTHFDFKVLFENKYIWSKLFFLLLFFFFCMRNNRNFFFYLVGSLYQGYVKNEMK